MRADGTVGAGAFSATFTFTTAGADAGERALVQAGASPTVAALAVQAYRSARGQGLSDSPVLSVIDFSRPSTEERLWIVDVEVGALLDRDHVTHGSGSNDPNDPRMASTFSNTPESHQSSLGLSLTAETYQGSNGLSLRLDGLEPSNDNVRARAIVMHGADYAEDAFVARYGYLGRSQGCPAVAQSRVVALIDLVKHGTLLFSYFPDDAWLSSSPFLTQ
ncbi:MAG: murein L,D-transpeptidase catalytic domain family protein [Deltaproteobacteria bacterium]|nr:murein L,D-transpeptidase catalytic domain family protein [Deltaproteobacteria bacterium]